MQPITANVRHAGANHPGLWPIRHAPKSHRMNRGAQIIAGCGGFAAIVVIIAWARNNVLSIQAHNVPSGFKTTE